MLSRLSSSPPSHLVAALTLVAAALATGGVVAVRMMPPGDPCAVPLDNLDPQTRGIFTHRTAVCRDYEAGRITKDEWREQTMRIDASLARPKATDNRIGIQWASAVLGFSSEYSTDSWSARQALGVPNVFPQHGDLAHAWASREADGSAEWIELGFAQPRPASAVEIYETFNAGAVDKVELITASGRRIELHPSSSMQTVGANKLVVETQCTTEPIAAVRIDLASQNVSGWNEIDAVGLRPCSPQ